jgi:hypothetical protein
MQTEAKTPTDKEKIAQYERFLHLINISIISNDNKTIQRLVSNADTWSYAHRVGNGETEEREQEKIIARKFWKLCDTSEK